MNASLPLAHLQRPCQGWEAELAVTFRPGATRTILGESRHAGPLTVQRPFYPETEVCHLYLLHPPGGLVGGDVLQFQATAESGASALMTTPGATKFYRSGGQSARQKQHFTVKKNAAFEWLPQETILFPGAGAELATDVELEENAVFIGWEILCFGLPCNQDKFLHGHLVSTLRINRRGRPLYLDRLRIENDFDLGRGAGLRNLPITATFAATGVSADMCEALRHYLASTGTVSGLTLIKDLMVARYLGESSQQARTLMQQLWAILRPRLLQRPACPPRIWST